jgi:hypothetical protein
MFRTDWVGRGLFPTVGAVAMTRQLACVGSNSGTHWRRGWNRSERRTASEKTSGPHPGATTRL